MNSKYSIKSFIVFWGLIFCATALFFSIVVTQVFFNSYILSSSFKELKSVSDKVDESIESKISSFETLQSEKIRSKYLLDAIKEKKYESIQKLFINWTEAHKLKDIFLYDEKGSLLDLKNGVRASERVNLSKAQLRLLNKGDLDSSCKIKDKGILVNIDRQIRDDFGLNLGFLSQRKEISFKEILNNSDDSILVVSNNKRVFYNSMKLNTNEFLKTASIFTNQKLDQFVLTINAEKYDFIKINPCDSFNLFIGQKNKQQEIYFNFYKKFFPFLVLFLFLTAVLFSVSFYRQILKPLEEISDKISSKKGDVNVDTNILEIKAISEVVESKISGLENKVKKSKEGRKEDINRLVASVAHELNNSLSYLGGNLEYLSSELQSDSIDKEEAIDAVKSANLGFQEIKKIVSDLKVFSSSGAIVKNDFKLRKIKERFLEKYSDLEFVGFDDEVIVVSDFERVMQILFNLVQNSKTADKSGSSLITLRYEIVEEDLQIFVEDTSGGVSSAIKKKIFEPFFTTKKTEGGTGLGLALSKNLAQSMDGDLKLIKTDAKGSTFCLILKQSV